MDKDGGGRVGVRGRERSYFPGEVRFCWSSMASVDLVLK